MFIVPKESMLEITTEIKDTSRVWKDKECTENHKTTFYIKFIIYNRWYLWSQEVCVVPNNYDDTQQQRRRRGQTTHHWKNLIKTLRI